MAICNYCGKKYTKTHNREMYCSNKCRYNALREQKAAYQRKRRKLIREGVLISCETTKVGSVFFPKTIGDWELEEKYIQRAKKAAHITF